MGAIYTRLCLWPIHIGGHTIISHTQTPQFIQGVEFNGLGQQGRLGRYPVHFHMCLDHAHSTVSKNTIRNSKQRGINIHGTTNLKIQNNILHSITGHGILQEDFYETGLEIYQNLNVQYLHQL